MATTKIEKICEPSCPEGAKLSRFNVRVPLRNGRALLFNSRSQQFSVLESDEADAFELCEKGEEELPERLANAFRLIGVLVPAGHDEMLSTTARFDGRRRDSSHLNLTIAATLTCNLACGYCFQGHNKPNGRMSDQVHEKVLALVADRIPALKSLHVTWYGGEPLMNAKEIWRTATALRLMCAGQDVKYTSLIITNGYLLNAQTAQKLVDHAVTHAQVTIDGTQAQHDRMRPHISGRGTFDVILRNVEAALAGSTLGITLRISVDAENIDGVNELLHLLNDRGLAKTGRLSVYFAPIEAITSGCAGYEALSLSKILYAQREVELMRLALSFGLRHHSFFSEDMGVCQAVRPDDLIVTPTGDLHKCWDTVSYENFRVGNITDANAAEALHGGLWSEWKPTDNPVCSSCKILPLCGGGCAFKTLHPDETAGEGASLPCISLKFNLAERLFDVALAAGAVRAEEWDPQMSPTVVDGVFKTGNRHSFESMRAATAYYQKLLHQKLLPAASVALNG